MGTLLIDLRYGFRMLGKNPGFTAVAVLTLALGIGANTTIFSWINSTLLNPIPGVAETGRIVTLTRGGTVEDPRAFSYLDYIDLRDRNHTLSGLMAADLRPMDLTGGIAGKPERIWGTLATANYFDVLGIRPILGRGFLPTEQRPGGAPVVVASYSFWQTHLGGSKDAIGRTLAIDHHPFTVVGVAPPAFSGSWTGLRTDIWVPVAMQREVMSSHDRLHDRGDTWLEPQGRLKPGVSLEQAQQELDLLMQQIAAQYPESHRGQNSVTLYPLWRAPDGANAYFYVLLPMLMGLAGIVLLLACANVANLLLVRSVGRRREMAIRLAIGAGRGRVVRQLLVESLLLALGGGGLAMIFTLWTAGTFAKFIPPTNFPVAIDVRADRAVLLAALGISVVACVVFGLLPALRASRLAPAEVLKEETLSAPGGRTKARLSSALVVAQLGLSLLLLISAGLFIRGFRKAQHFNPGFNPDHVYVATFDLFPTGLSEAQGKAFDRQLLDRIAALPGVQSASLVDALPLGLIRNTDTINPAGYTPRPHEGMEIRSASAGPGYLRTLGIPLAEGREFGSQDTEESQPVAVVNEALAERYWPRQDALGKRVLAEGDWHTVVGVAQNSNYDRLNETPQPFLYLPLSQDFNHTSVIVARVGGDPLAWAPAIERAAHGLNADLPLYDVGTLAANVKLASTNERIAGTFVGVFGLLALVLATVGIYGVVSYATRQRTNEIGIRMALGAARGDVFRLVLGQGLRLTLAGLAAGLALSLALTPLLRSELFGVTTSDPLTFGGVSLLLCLASSAACYIPARRATTVDPMVALRYE